MNGRAVQRSRQQRMRCTVFGQCRGRDLPRGMRAVVEVTTGNVVIAVVFQLDFFFVDIVMVAHNERDQSSICRDWNLSQG